MDFRILGPLEVHAGGELVPLPGAKPRAVLAMLLLHANRPVAAERIAQAIWGEDAPAGAANTVQVHVSRLRKALGRPRTTAGIQIARDARVSTAITTTAPTAPTRLYTAVCANTAKSVSTQ